VKTNNKGKKVMVYLITPLLFCFFGYLILFMITFPVSSKLNDYINLLISDKPPQFNTQINNIFTYNSHTNQGTVNMKNIEFPKYNTIYGKFEIKSVGISYPLIFGDSSEALKKGAGQYNGSYIAGYGGTILIAGHDYMFKKIGDTKIGDIIMITTSYGTYNYKITDKKILNKDDKSAYTIQKSKEQLVFYTCYPFNALASITTRYFVYADYVSGPKIVQ
jgi:sortase A